jgi:hypothetical protein
MGADVGMPREFEALAMVLSRSIFSERSPRLKPIHRTPFPRVRRATKAASLRQLRCPTQRYRAVERDADDLVAAAG